MIISDEGRSLLYEIGISLLAGGLVLASIDGSEHSSVRAAAVSSIGQLVVPSLPVMIDEKVVPLRRDPFAYVVGVSSGGRDPQAMLPANAGAQWMPLVGPGVETGLRLVALSVGSHSSALLDDSGNLVTVSDGDELHGRRVVRITDSGIRWDDGSILRVSGGGLP